MYKCFHRTSILHVYLRLPSHNIKMLTRKLPKTDSELPRMMLYARVCACICPLSHVSLYAGCCWPVTALSIFVFLYRICLWWWQLILPLPWPHANVWCSTPKFTYDHRVTLQILPFRHCVQCKESCCWICCCCWSCEVFSFPFFMNFY